MQIFSEILVIKTIPNITSINEIAYKIEIEI